MATKYSNWINRKKANIVNLYLKLYNNEDEQECLLNQLLYIEKDYEKHIVRICNLKKEHEQILEIIDDLSSKIPYFHSQNAHMQAVNYYNEKQNNHY